MGWLYFAVILVTIIAGWYSASRNLKAKGRGQFFRHWIGGTIACTAGVLQAMSFYADWWVWNVVGFLIAALIVNGSIDTRKKMI